MRILIAPDSFKGSLSALHAAQCMVRGMQRVFPHAEYDYIPIADGGEGTVAALVAATAGTCRQTTVRNPLGENITAEWGLLGDGCSAVVEMAAASGLFLIPPSARNPQTTSTYGTGELIAAALSALHTEYTTKRIAAEALGQGAALPPRPRLILGIGGSATNDGGTGALRALGVTFHDAHGAPLPEGGAALARLARIDASGIHPLLKETDILIACDVDNPLCGARGASAVFGPQKGASPDDVALLDAALCHYGRIARETTGKDRADVPGAGAAGGLGAAFLFFTDAALRSGVELVLEVTGFADRVAQADLVITGEGHTDFQTAYGKAPVGVAQLAKRFHKPVICISGGLGTGAHHILDQGVDALAGAICSVVSLEECMENAGALLENAVEQVGRILRVGGQLGAT